MPLQASCCTRAAKLWAGAAQARIPFDRVETWKKESRSRWLQDWWASPAVFQHLLFTSRWAKHSLTRHNMWIPLHCFCCCHSAGKPQWATPRAAPESPVRRRRRRFANLVVNWPYQHLHHFTRSPWFSQPPVAKRKILRRKEFWKWWSRFGPTGLLIKYLETVALSFTCLFRRNYCGHRFGISH